MRRQDRRNPLHRHKAVHVGLDRDGLGILGVCVLVARQGDRPPDDGLVPCGLAIPPDRRDGVYCIAVPILDRTDFPLAAIWVTGPMNRVPSSRYPAIAARLNALVGTISAAVGHVPEEH